MSDVHQTQRTKRGLDPMIAAELGDLLHELSQDKKTRKVIAKAIREAKPDSPHAAAFADVDVEDKFEAFRKEQEDKDLERQRQAVIDRQNAQRNALLTGGPDGTGRKYSEDDVKAIEALMTKKGIGDYDDGATLYAATLPPVDPKPSEIPQHGATYEFPTVAGMKFEDFAKDPTSASRNAAHSVITEFMRKR